MEVANIDNLRKENSDGFILSEDLYLHLRRDKDDTFIPQRTRLDMLGICIVCHGSYRIKVNSVGYRLVAGEVLICHPNDFYEEIFFSKDFAGIILFASADLIFDMVDRTHLQDCLKYLKSTPVIKPEKDIWKLLNAYFSLIEVQTRLIRGKTVDNRTLILNCKSLIAELFNRMLHSVSHDFKEKRSTANSKNIYQNFINLLVTTPERPHNQQWYADQLCVSTGYLAAVCRKESGKTAVEWIKEYIMNDARRYLLSTDMSIKEIASRLGFSNFSFFCKAIKRRFGLTPMQIRASKAK